MARSCNYHTQAIRHIRHLLTTELTQTLACCVPLRSKLQHQEVAASRLTEQRSSNRSRSIKTISRQPVAEDVKLAARSAENRVQSSSADVQSPQHIDAVVPLSPNPGPTIQPQPAIGHYDAVSTSRYHDFLRSTLTDALLRLFGIHYRKLSLIVTITVLKSRLKTFLFSRAFSRYTLVCNFDKC